MRTLHGCFEKFMVAPHLAGAAHRLEACATKGGGRDARPTDFAGFAAGPTAPAGMAPGMDNIMILHANWRNNSSRPN